MPTQIMPTLQYGLFNCEYCASNAAEAARIIREATSLEDEGLGRLADLKCGDQCGGEWADELPTFPIELRTPVDDEMREPVEEATGCSLPEDALYADIVLTLIEADPEEGRARLDRILTDEAWWWPTCKCCGRRAQLVKPLVPIA